MSGATGNYYKSTLLFMESFLCRWTVLEIDKKLILYIISGVRKSLSLITKLTII